MIDFCNEEDAFTPLKSSSCLNANALFKSKILSLRRIPVIEDCAYQSCLTCAPGLGKRLNDTQCLPCSHGEFLTNQICIKCPDHCTSCTSLSTCTSCIQSYFLSDGTCLPCDEGCKKCSSSGFCQQCDLGWALQDNNTCSYCPTGLQFSQSQCTGCPNHCSSCINDQCLSCSTGYVLSNNRCVSCPTGTVFNTLS